MVITEQTVFFLAIPIYIVLINICLRKQYKFSKIFLYSLSFFYIVWIIAFAIFPINFDSRNEFMINLNLFHTYYDIEMYEVVGTPWKSIKQILWNFILLLPAGIIIPIVYPKIKKSLHIIFIWFLISFLIEFLQLLQWFIGIPLKIFDIDDIVLNILWYILGFIIYKIVKRKK